MGSRASKLVETTKPHGPNEEKIVCENCAKETQKDLPADEPDQCMEQYFAVDLCMKENRGQVTSCVQEWKEFHACHASQKQL